MREAIQDSRRVTHKNEANAEERSKLINVELTTKEELTGLKKRVAEQASGPHLPSRELPCSSGLREALG